MKKRIILLGAVFLFVLFLGGCAASQPETTMYLSYGRGPLSGELASHDPKYFYDRSEAACIGVVEEIQSDSVFVGPKNTPYAGDALTKATVRVTEVLKGDLDDTIEVCYVSGTIPIEDYLDHFNYDGPLSREELKEHYATDEELKNLREVSCTSDAAKKVLLGQRTLFILYETPGIDCFILPTHGLTVYPIDGNGEVFLSQYPKYETLEQLKSELMGED